MIAAMSLACGARVVTEPAPSDAAVCVATTPACTLPGAGAPDDACSVCVGSAICRCHDLNAPLDWRPPAGCDTEGEVCGDAGYLPDQHACQVAAVQLTMCMAHDTQGTCSGRYFSEHPHAIEPLGMEFALYHCAVCTDCASVCSHAPDFATFCR